MLAMILLQPGTEMGLGVSALLFPIMVGLFLIAVLAFLLMPHDNW